MRQIGTKTEVLTPDMDSNASGSIWVVALAFHIMKKTWMRQDLPDNQDIFAFPEERQKAQSLFDGAAAHN